MLLWQSKIASLLQCDMMANNADFCNKMNWPTVRLAALQNRLVGHVAPGGPKVPRAAAHPIGKTRVPAKTHTVLNPARRMQVQLAAAVAKDENWDEF